MEQQEPTDFLDFFHQAASGHGKKVSAKPVITFLSWRPATREIAACTTVGLGEYLSKFLFSPVKLLDASSSLKIFLESEIKELRSRDKISSGRDSFVYRDNSFVISRDFLVLRIIGTTIRKFPIFNFAQSSSEYLITCFSPTLFDGLCPVFISTTNKWLPVSITRSGLPLINGAANSGNNFHLGLALRREHAY